MAVLVAMMAAFMAAGNGSTDPDVQHIDEYQVKAAYLYNFAKFVEWPTGTFRTPGEPFPICILGEDPFGSILDEAVAGKSTGGRPFAVRRVSDEGGSRACRILFVSSLQDKHVRSVLVAVQQHGSVLTVGDKGLSTAEGLVMGFLMVNGRVRFEIDQAAGDRAGLHISAKLLALAQVAGK